jgi:hypothetical protein
MKIMNIMFHLPTSPVFHLQKNVKTAISSTEDTHTTNYLSLVITRGVKLASTHIPKTSAYQKH